MENNVFAKFESGKLLLAEYEKNLSDVPWSVHPTFDGVALKHLVTAKDTNGQFSYHLVKIAPGKTIGNHVHATQLETHEVISGSGVCINNGKEFGYEPGIISILPLGVPHEVHAGDKGLYLFAKFIPALC